MTELLKKLKVMKRLGAICMAITMILFYSSITLFAAEVTNPAEITSEDENTSDATTETNSSTEDENTSDATTETNTPTEDENTSDATTETNTPTEDEDTSDATTETNAPTEDENTTETTTEANTPTIGQKITVGNYIYKITSDNTVTLKGFAEGVTKSKVIVKKQITYNGTTYTVTKVGNRAFKNENSITQVLVRKNTVTIGQGAFNNCKSLTSVIIKTGVKTIGKNAFKNCSKLKNIIITSTVLTTIKSNGFKNINSDAIITVKNEKIQSFIKTVVPATVTVVTM